MRRIVTFIVVLTMALAILSACSSASIIGSWWASDPSQLIHTAYGYEKDYSKISLELVFKDDDTVTIYQYIDGIIDWNSVSTAVYHYSHNKLSIGSTTYDCKISGNTMTWSLNGTEITLKRK